MTEVVLLYRTNLPPFAIFGLLLRWGSLRRVRAARMQITVVDGPPCLSRTIYLPRLPSP